MSALTLKHSTMVGAAGLPTAKRDALRNDVEESLRATSAFKPMASRLGSHPVASLTRADFSGLRISTCK
jgi:hypothetical protein